MSNIDIEKLAREHDVYEIGDYENRYPISLEKLEAFAEAYAEQQRQEQEPVGEMANDARTGHVYNILFYGHGVPIGTKLFTTPPIQPLKRLSQEQVFKAIDECTGYYSLANAIMDEMERINNEK